MKSTLTLVLIIIATLSSSAQLQGEGITLDNFEAKFLEYIPVKKAEVSEERFKWATFVISQTKDELKNDIAQYNVVHYLNILSAFNALNEEIEVLEIAMKKFAESDGSCEYILNYKDKFQFVEKIPELYNFYFERCKKCKALEKKPEFDLGKYIEANGYDRELLHMIHKILIDDEKYRKDDEKKFEELQPALDLKNQVRIDSLFALYNCYIGKSMVGKKFESVMWAVVQHSNLEMMERYLPIVHKAVREKELHPTPLKMLIDRIYALKYGYQIFGSQSGGLGVKIADERTRKEIEKKYGFE